MTSGTKKHIQTQDYQNNPCYQLNGYNNNQSTLGYPPPPSYGAPMHQYNGTGGQSNPAFQTSQGLFGYSRPPSPGYPHSTVSSLKYNKYSYTNIIVNYSHSLILIIIDSI